jgi:uncharacterized protein YjbJ (UPF0337 family)
VWTLPPHRASKLAERFGIEPEDDWVPRYNVAPTQNVEVIRQHAIWCKNDDPACAEPVTRTDAAEM